MHLSYCLSRAFRRNLCLQGAIALFSLFPHHPLQAQIFPDDTLPINSLVTPNGNTFVIDGGMTAGNNLFHSFGEFSLPTGKEAFFNNPLTIENIIGRITGGSISNIDGLIRANGTANLFLLNPNGIVFGPNASLNIGGSFLGSTANSINFADGTQFSAINPQAQPLLTVSVPVGLGFGSNPGAIRVQGTGNLTIAGINSSGQIIGAGSSLTGLRVQPGKTLALVGGDVVLEGGILTAPQGRIELGGVGSGLVSLSPNPVGWTLGYERVQSFRNIELRLGALADASGTSGGSIQLQGARLSLTDGSIILIQNQGLQEPATSISVNASESLEVSGTSPDGRTASRLITQTVAPENGEDIASRPRYGGNIAVSTQRLVLRDGGVITAKTLSGATGGNLNVNASESVQVLGFSPINPNLLSFISATATSSGNAGNITVSTRRLMTQDGGGVISTTFGTGNGGNVIVNATESVELIGVQPGSFAPSGVSASTINAGNAGNTTINTRQLTVQNGARVDSSTLSSGSAGSVTVNASEFVEVSGSVPGSVNPSLIISSANIVDKFLRDILGLPPVPSGDSGKVEINTPRLSVTDGAQVTVRNDGTGAAGTLRINADSIFLDNQGGITAVAASKFKEEDNIILQTQNLQLRHNSAITATSLGNDPQTSNGGNIKINTDTLVALEASNITANAKEGRGGNITITAQAIFLSPDSKITASSQRGPQFDGIVQLNTPDIDLQSTLNQVEANFVSTEQAIANSCLARRNVERGSFTVTGTGGLPQNPYEAISGRYAVTQVQGLPAEARQQASSPSLPTPHSPTRWKLGDPIQEAQGMTVTADGRIIVGTASQLVAAAQPQDLICNSSAQSSASRVISP